MLKKLIVLMLIVSCLGCDKKQQDEVGCLANLSCTMEFAMISINFKDRDGNGVIVKDLTAINQRTKESILPTDQRNPTAITMAGYYVITDDSKLSKFSTDGDDVIVSAKHPTTGQVKTAVFKISGGCTCHVRKISGPQTITFD